MSMRAFVYLLGFAFAASAHSQTPRSPAPSLSPDAVLVSAPGARITKSDYDNELLRLPPDLRPGFANNARRIDDLLQRMIVTRVLAVQARDLKIDQDPEVLARLQIEIERFLSQTRIARFEVEAAAEFDARRSQWESRAREIYAVERKRFELPERVSASHILFKTEKRTSDEAKQLAEAARVKVIAGADFNALAKEVSEDSSARMNSGKLDLFAAPEMAPAFSDAAFALKNIGDISLPVQTQFGWHVIKLEERKPASQRSYDEVKESILGELRQKYISDKRDLLVASVRNDPQLKYNREAIDALVIRPDIEAAKRALSAPSAAPVGVPK
jgi:peptidyl-prolyl cis-trans isomerase C